MERVSILSGEDQEIGFGISLHYSFLVMVCVFTSPMLHGGGANEANF